MKNEKRKKKKKNVGTFPQSNTKIVEILVQSIAIATAHFAGLYRHFNKKKNMNE